MWANHNLSKAPGSLRSQRAVIVTYVYISLFVLFCNLLLGFLVGSSNPAFSLNSMLCIYYPSDAWYTQQSSRFHQPNTILSRINFYSPSASIPSSRVHSISSISILTFKCPRVFQSSVFESRLRWAEPDHWVIRLITLVIDAGRGACWMPRRPRGHEILRRSSDHKGLVLQHGCLRGP